MHDLFQTILRLSLLGSVIILVLLCLRPLLVRAVPPRWQTWLWGLALVVMVLPVYQWVPVSQPVPDPPTLPVRQIQTEVPTEDTQAEPSETNQAVSPAPTTGSPYDTQAQQLTLTHLGYLWAAGTVAFLAVLLGNYGRFLVKLSRNSIKLSEHPLFQAICQEQHIHRSIPLRVVPSLSSPMLVGVLFPVVYLPDADLPQEHLRMVLLHELTHYKRKDLLLKWLALLVNALHWFNPLAWLLTRSLGQACEDACDRDVTRTMSTEERKQYMYTILTLAQA